MEEFRFIINQPIQIEEDLKTEFKEVRGAKPVNIIKNTVDEYAVAFLNRTGGSIYWGIRDSDRTVVGVHLNHNQRDDLRKVVDAQLASIQPPVTPNCFNQSLHKVFEDENSGSVIPDLIVLEVEITKPNDDELYFTGGHEAFIKTESGKAELSGLKLQSEIMRRLQRKIDPDIVDTNDVIDAFPGLSPALRRAKLVSNEITGSQVLWVDDNPGNNIYERMVLKSLGITVEVAVSSEEALLMLKLQPFDAIISDIYRKEGAEAGISLLREIRSMGFETRLIFYVGKVDYNRGVPIGAFGLTQFPDELVHLVLDILERVRI